jgi:hypothetical protein
MAAALACTPLGPALTRGWLTALAGLATLATLAAEEGAVTVSATQAARTTAPAHRHPQAARIAM